MTLRPPAVAERMAEELQAGDEDGWTYRIEDVGNARGLVRIDVYDENGEYLATY